MAVYTDLHPTDIKSVVTDSTAIDVAIGNILNTTLSSIPGNPTFGTGLESFLFEQLDFISVNMMENLITDALQTYEPRITNISVVVSQQPEYNRININITYTIKSTGTSQQVTINIK